MTFLDKDWAYLRTAIPELQEYLLSKELYWQLSQDSRMLQLTVGNLLLSQKKLTAVTWPESEGTELLKLSGDINQIRERWRANWIKKASQEFSARLKLWSRFLSQDSGSRAISSSDYAQQVRLRAILSILLDEVPIAGPGEMEHLAALDQLLHGLAKSGPFIWDSKLSAGFDREKYWFLYMSIIT